MNDQAAKYLKMIKSHVDRVVVGVVYALLAVLVWFWYSEEMTTGGEQEGRKLVLVDPIPNNPSRKLLMQAKETPDIAKFPTIEQVRRFNMFDVKTVKEKRDIEKQADDKFKQAQDFASKGQTEEAKRLLTETLQSFPTHKQAKELFDKLSGPKEGAASAATPSPGATTTGAAAVTPTPAQIQ